MLYHIKKNRISCSYIWFITVLSLFSCNKVKVPIEVQHVLDQSGNNKSQLEDVIYHYSKSPIDSLKLKAAYFLIINMEGQHYYEGELLEHYQDYLKLITRDKSHGAYFMRSLNELYGKFSYKGLNKFDVEEIKSTELITNIEMAFKVWKEQPWGKDISFSIFCEYILPFRIDNEIPGYNSRAEIYNQFNGSLDSVRKAGGDAVAACIAINKQLMKTPYLFSSKIGFLPHSPAIKLIKYKVGTCREMTDLAVFVMRAVGIPVATAVIPQWAYRNMGDDFNLVIDKHGKAIPFMGAEDNPGNPHKPGKKRAKIYLRTYTKNPLSLAMQSGSNNVLPSFLRNPRIIDVTDDYVQCFDINISLNKTFSGSEKFAYLSVFNNTRWVPVHWGKAKNNKVIFTKMEGGIVYLPCYFNESGLIPTNYPFILDTKGQVKYLIIDSNKTQNMVLSNRYDPYFKDWFITDSMLGGRFQGSNNIDFNDAVDLYKITTNPNPLMNEITISGNKKYRFVRYLAPSHKYCQIGELEFYASGLKLKGKILGTNDSKDAAKYTLEKAMDNNMSTSFFSKSTSNAWVGLDLGKPIKVDKLKFSSYLFEAENRIKFMEGQRYELFYWGNNHWISAGMEIPKASVLSFNNVPSNTLYYLKALEHSQYQRIFTYENDRQIWR